MSAVSTGPALRERKKEQTRRALSSAAVRLVRARGLDEVTVADIAAAAGVSRRTFFNYFSSKEDAVVGTAKGQPGDLLHRVADQPEGEPPLALLHRAILEHLEGFDRQADDWRARRALVQRYPTLAARHIAALTEAEQGLAGAVARATGLDPEVDVYSRTVVSAALGAARSAIACWYELDRRVPLSDLVDEAFGHLERGLAR